MGRFHGVGMNGIIVGVGEIERVSEGVSVLKSTEWINYACVSSRTHWVKFKFLRAKLGVVVVWSH